MNGKKPTCLVIGMLIIASLLLLCGCIYIIFLIDTGGHYVSKDEIASQNPTKIELVDLLDEYAANETVAAEKYETQYVQSSGIIESFNKDIWENDWIKLSILGSGYNDHTAACFVKNPEKISELVTGDYVSFKGKPSKLVFSELDIKECTLLEKLKIQEHYTEGEKSQAKQLDFIEFASEYINDPVNARNKYRGQVIKLSGTKLTQGEDYRDNAWISIINKDSKLKFICFLRNSIDKDKLSQASKLTIYGKPGIFKDNEVTINDCEAVTSK